MTENLTGAARTQDMLPETSQVASYTALEEVVGDLDLSTLQADELIYDLVENGHVIDAIIENPHQNDRPLKLLAFRIDKDSPHTAIADAVERAYYEVQPKKDSKVSNPDQDEESFSIVVIDATHEEYLRPTACLRINSFTDDSTGEIELTDFEKRRGLWEVSPPQTLKDYDNGRAVALAYRALVSQIIAEGRNRIVTKLTGVEFSMPYDTDFTDEFGTVSELFDLFDENTRFEVRSKESSSDNTTYDALCVINLNLSNPIPRGLREAYRSWTAPGERMTRKEARDALWLRSLKRVETIGKRVADSITTIAEEDTEEQRANNGKVLTLTGLKYTGDPVVQDEPKLEIIKFKPVYDVGVVAILGTVIEEDIYHQLLELRANVYIDEKGFLSAESRNDDGEESDEYDNRSTHIAVTEKIDTDEGTKRSVIGTARLIHKRDEAEILPVEKYFDIEAPVGSTEASRYIARHPDKQIQAATSLALIISLANEANNIGSENVYAVVERPLETKFKWLGLPLSRMTEPRFLEDYNTMNAAIRFDPSKSIAGISGKRPKEYHAVKDLVAGL